MMKRVIALCCLLGIVSVMVGCGEDSLEASNRATEVKLPEHYQDQVDALLLAFDEMGYEKAGMVTQSPDPDHGESFNLQVKSEAYDITVSLIANENKDVMVHDVAVFDPHEPGPPLFIGTLNEMPEDFQFIRDVIATASDQQ